MAVDCLVRFLCEGNSEDAFSISLQGAFALGLSAYEKAYDLLEDVSGLNTKSIKSACQLVGFDCVYRAGRMFYKPVEDIQPDDSTIRNIRTMVEIERDFINENGPFIGSGYSFEGGYSKNITIGDCDFIVGDMILDSKVMKRTPDKNDTLQVLVYYILGIRSKKNVFKNIKRIGIINPRKKFLTQ